ncbi:MarR family winged helix-turn-helix transcriptional regulator [Henriciella litoralis]|uniref:MarR family winged helix-turn-helix transcriptional regulator n=1 Tax=Henriciella litoralis TaxID=568102 RepID=UPI000A079DF3|nr:MarR family transcriptional regulator [Henriciella litoralis]
MANQIPYETTIHVRDHCLCLAAQRAARALARRFDEAFRHLGITSGQYSLLMALNRPAPPPLGPVAELLAMDRTTLTANLKPLVRRGLVKIIQNPADKRSRLLKLTDAGHELLLQAVPIWKSEHAAIDAEIEALQPDVLRKGLSALA